MINVLIEKNRIKMTGHANTGQLGKDIVCAAVSAITLTLIEGLKNIAHMEIEENTNAGDVMVEWQDINDTGKALIDTWFLGICGIAGEYPVIEFL